MEIIASVCSTHQQQFAVIIEKKSIGDQNRTIFDFHLEVKREKNVANNFHHRSNMLERLLEAISSIFFSSKTFRRKIERKLENYFVPWKAPLQHSSSSIHLHVMKKKVFMTLTFPSFLLTFFTSIKLKFWNVLLIKRGKTFLWRFT